MINNWNVLCYFLPQGWIQQSKVLGAYTRTRNISSPKKLLRLLLIHIADGHSLRETTVIAKEGKICNISDVALYERLKSASEWFRWMSIELIKKRGIEISVPKWLKPYKIKTVDATVITEPGSTGTDWRLHYSLNLYELSCDQFILTQPGIGENFTNFKVEKGDIFIGDRAYGKLKGMKHIKDNEGEFLVRLQSNAFSFQKDGKEFNLLEEISRLKEGKILEWSLEGINQQGLRLPMRICALRKSDKEAEKSIKKAKRNASKKQTHLKQETLEFCKYIVIATSLPETIRAELILELYRFRWQVEIAFKRLKSLLGLGHLPKKDECSCKSWLQGKIFTALLVQAIVLEGRNFSPWGYPMRR